jgi:hypothetical protein
VRRRLAWQALQSLWWMQSDDSGACLRRILARLSLWPWKVLRCEGGRVLRCGRGKVLRCEGVGVGRGKVLRCEGIKVGRF